MFFSNSDDKNYFTSKINIKNFIIMDDQLYSSCGNIITFKKIFGLYKIFYNYDYIGVFDAETQFVRKFDSDIIYPEIFNTKYLKCNTATGGGHIVKHVASIINLVENKKLLKETKNFTQYWWFNEIHVYEKNTFFEFFKFINQHKMKNSILNEFLCFDYILYGIWLICFRDFKCKHYFEGVDFSYGAIEYNKDDNVTEIFNSYLDHTPNYQKYEKIKVIIQKDRGYREIKL